MRRHRLAAGLSQEGLAERAGLSTQGISALERGVNRNPQRETVLRLAEALALAGEARAAFEAAARRRPTGSAPVEDTLPGLPVPLTALVGREAEVEVLSALLGDPAVRLVTLTGPGGVGKTRLALATAAAVAASFPDGVFFVPLAGLADPALVLTGLGQPVGVRAGGGRSLLEALISRLRARRALFVLDNFEHLLAAAADLAALLEGCPHLTVLITSRTKLRVRGEREIQVAPLALPDRHKLSAAEAVGQSPAVALFVARLQEQQPRFALSPANARPVAEICIRLDGLPLALELAAAQGRTFSPQALLVRLDRRLAVLTAGPRDLPLRQQTLRATLAWSYDLLDAGAQLLFQRLAVFSGGCTLEALEAIAAPGGGLDDAALDALGALVDASLLHQTGEARFTMLETMREYGLERLAAGGGLAESRRAHALYYRSLAERAEPALRGAEQAEWLERLEAEHDNLRAALRWALREGGDPALGLSLARYLGLFWEKRSHLSEGRGWLEQALAACPEAESGARAAALNYLGVLAYAQGDMVRAQAVYQEGLALRRVLGDPRDLNQSLTNMGNVALALGEYAQATAWYEESLAIAEQSGNPTGRATVLNNLGVLARAQGDQERALVLYEECYQIYRAQGDSWRMAVMLANLGNLTSTLGDLARAHGLYRESLVLRRDLGDRQGIVLTLLGLGHLAHRQDRAEEAARLLGAGTALGEEIGLAFPASGLAEHEQILQAVRQHLGEQSFAAAWAAGAALGMDQAIAVALSSG